MLLSGAAERWRLWCWGCIYFLFLVRLDAFEHRGGIIRGTAHLQKKQRSRELFGVGCLRTGDRVSSVLVCRLMVFLA